MKHELVARTALAEASGVSALDLVRVENAEVSPTKATRWGKPVDCLFR